MKASDDMNIRFDRLKQIAEDVRNAKRGYFNMTSWKYFSECGTVCCAIGHHIEARPSCELGWGEGFFGGAAPQFKELHGFEAITAYLGISRTDALYLFDSDHYTERQCADRSYVASRIDQFIRDHRESPVVEMKPSAAAPVAARQLEGEGT